MQLLCTDFILFQFSIIYEIPIEIVHNTPLIGAAENGHTEIVQLLLSQPKIEINHKNI